MASSRKDSYILNKLFVDFINGLTEEQFSNLINGTAELKYTDKGLDNVTKERFKDILYYTALAQDNAKSDYIKSRPEINSKAKLVEFCKYINVEYKAKDTIDSIIQNILSYIEKNHDTILYKVVREDSIEKQLDEISKKIEEFMNLEEARNFILSKDILNSKTNLIKLAKRLNVFIDREGTYDNILDKILSSVVEAKIRSYTIRKKI